MTIYNFASLPNRASISFLSGQDVLVFPSLSAAKLSLTQSGEDLLVKNPSGKTLTLLDLDQNMLTSGSFLFGDGSVALFGSPANETLYVEPEQRTLSNYLDGGPGNDVLQGGDGNDKLLGGQGDDLFFYSAGDDVLYGGDGNDRFVGVPRPVGRPTIYAGDGDDTIGFVPGTFFGGAGDDTLVVRLDGWLNAFHADFSTGKAELVGGGTGTFSGIEHLDFVGGMANDIVTGGAHDDYLATVGGNDVLNGAGGNDIIYGADGNDILSGGDGNDELDAGLHGNDQLLGGNGNDFINLFNRAADEIFMVNGGAGTDLLRLSLETDGFATGWTFSLPDNTAVVTSIDVDGKHFGTITGIERLELYATNRADNITGGNADDIIFGGDGDDTLVGRNGNDDLSGNYGNDVLDGGKGNDRLDGGIEADVLRGGQGDDILIGGGGTDTLTGGLGADTFVFDMLEANATKDTIKDFVSGTDHIELGISAFTGLAGYGRGTLDVGELAYGTKATATGQHLIYNIASGGLFYDVDGVGGAAQVQIAMLSSHPALNAGDIVIV